MVFQYLVDKYSEFWDIAEFEKNPERTELIDPDHLNRDLLR